MCCSCLHRRPGTYCSSEHITWPMKNVHEAAFFPLLLFFSCLAKFSCSHDCGLYRRSSALLQCVLTFMIKMKREELHDSSLQSVCLMGGTLLMQEFCYQTLIMEGFVCDTDCKTPSREYDSFYFFFCFFNRIWLNLLDVYIAMQYLLERRRSNANTMQINSITDTQIETALWRNNSESVCQHVCPPGLWKKKKRKKKKRKKVCPVQHVQDRT